MYFFFTRYSNGWHKLGMVVEYSQTMKRFILLDPYALPNINKQFIEFRLYIVFSVLDINQRILSNPSSFCGLPFYDI